MQFHILEVPLRSEDEQQRCEGLAVAGGLSFAFEFGADGEPLCLRAYSSEKFQLEEFAIRWSVEFPNTTFNWQVMDASAVESGWRDDDRRAWNSANFRITVENNPTPSEEPDHIVIAAEGGAFGDGQHITTELMLTCLENVIVDCQPDSLLDFGAGTGILAIAGAKLKVPSVDAWEIDSTARSACQVNLGLNQVNRVRLLDSAPAAQRYDVVCCNIQPPLLTNLAGNLDSCLRLEGTLILSGFTRLDEGAVHSVFSSLGFRHLKTVESANWLAQVWQKS